MFFLHQSSAGPAPEGYSLFKSLAVFLFLGFTVCGEGSVSTTFAENEGTTTVGSGGPTGQEAGKVIFTEPQDGQIHGVLGETQRNQLGSGIVSGVDVERVEAQAIHQPLPSHSFVVRIKTNAFQTHNHENFLDLYFDENRSFIRDEVSGTLEEIARLLLDEPQSVLFMDAHCDQRGSKAYSLTIGDRWAHHVQTYLSHFGLPRDRISRVTYGGEKVWCRGQSVSCWEANLLTKQVFGLMAPIDPHNGCLVRLSLTRRLSGSYLAAPIPHIPTLQRLHLAQTP